jgi:hypothetical protein
MHLCLFAPEAAKRTDHTTAPATIRWCHERWQRGIRRFETRTRQGHDVLIRLQRQDESPNAFHAGSCAC